MTGRVVAALLSALIQAPGNSAQQQQQPPKTSIEGVVLRSGTGEPLSHAQVKLSRVASGDESLFYDGNGDPASRGLPSMLTESDGKFLLKDLEPGQYRLVVNRNGYAEQSYGQKVPNGPNTIINLIPGEALQNVVFRLVPAGTITGRVRDASGQPVAGLSVSAMRVEFGDEGKKNLWQESSSETDDRGEYRLYWLKPGRYTVRASPARQEDFGNNRRVVIDPNISSAYYPGSISASTASVIEIQPGSELAGIDIVLPKPAGHWIRGRLVDSATGKPPKSATVGVALKERGDVEDYSDFNSGRGQYNPNTGSFEIRNINPGTYWISASKNSFDEPLSADRLAEVRTGNDIFDTVFSSGAAAHIQIEMGLSDLNDVVLTLAKGSTVPVRVGVEGPELSAVKDVDKIRVNLMPAMNEGIWRSSSRLNGEGVARIENVLPGEYRVNVDKPKSANLYVKEVLYGRNNVLHDSFQVNDQRPDSISVLLSDRGGRIEGTLTDVSGQAVSGVQVVLAQMPRDKSSSIQAEPTDHDGRFTFTTVPPGSYKLFSWEALEENSYYDKEVLSKYDALGKAVQVQESSKVTADVRQIPAAKQ